MIDKITVDRILNAADIVDVVSDFVTLKRRGTSWVGLCPFHNDRNPSFYVSRNKNICKCFACGEGGTPLNFIMKIEQLNYVDALKYLARKYGIEVQERELTDKERVEQTHREGMLMLNEWACKYFEEQLHETTEGKEVGMAYFNERGFNAQSIKKFRLGYSPEKRDAFYQAATKQGFNRELLFEVGLCFDDNHGGGRDRFHGRVMFPIFNVGGKVVGFGGRTLHKDEKAKYMNSPESLIYNKRLELYGLYQAKRAIGKAGKCFIVEGYADVISMHQAGFENVIASSGTALTEGQIRAIHRFTDNVTELFDGDAAGIHAALRGVDLLLAEGLKIKVLLLPDGEDPDSYSQQHSSSEVQAYIDDNETDFITFKTRVLLKGAEGDPIKRSEAIIDVVKSIAVIPDPIVRNVYAKACSAQFGIEEKTLLSEIAKYVAQNRERAFKQREQERERQQRLAAAAGSNATATTEPAASDGATTDTTAPATGETTAPEQPAQPDTTAPATPITPAISRSQRKIIGAERAVATYIAKYGVCYLCETDYGDGIARETTVIEYLRNEIEADNLEFAHPAYRAIYKEALDILPTFRQELEAYEANERSHGDARYNIEISHIDATGHTADSLADEEKKARARVDQAIAANIAAYRENYLEKWLLNHPDELVRTTTLELVSEREPLSKIFTERGVVVNDAERLLELIPKALNKWKYFIIMQRIDELNKLIRQGDCDLRETMQELTQLNTLKMEIAKVVGDIVVNPK